jgi:hypothetical protein
LPALFAPLSIAFPTLFEAAVLTYCKIDVYILRSIGVLPVVLGNKSLFVRHIGSQRVVEALVAGRFEFDAARARRPRSPFDSPQRWSGSKAPAAAKSSGFSWTSR